MQDMMATCRDMACVENDVDDSPSSINLCQLFMHASVRCNHCIPISVNCPFHFTYNTTVSPSKKSCNKSHYNLTQLILKVLRLLVKQLD